MSENAATTLPSLAEADYRYQQLPAVIIEHLKAAGYLANDAGDACRCFSFDPAQVYYGQMEFPCHHPGFPVLCDPGTPYIRKVRLHRVEWILNDFLQARVYVGSCALCKCILFSSETPLERLEELATHAPFPQSPDGRPLPGGSGVAYEP